MENVQYVAGSCIVETKKWAQNRCFCINVAKHYVGLINNNEQPWAKGVKYKTIV